MTGTSSSSIHTSTSSAVTPSAATGANPPKKLWTTAKRILKPKRSSHLSKSALVTSTIEATSSTDVNISPNKTTVDFPLFEFTPEFNGTPSKSSPTYDKIALPSIARSKATVGTASTTLSTVNSTLSPSFTLTPSSAGLKTAASNQDEFSYSCATSSQWTGSGNVATPSPCFKSCGGGTIGSVPRGVPGLPLAEKKGGKEEKEGGDDDDESVKEDEEKDGFVQLITERQRSRRISVDAVPKLVDNLSASTIKTPESGKANESAPSEANSQGEYYSQGYDLMGFTQSSTFQSSMATAITGPSSATQGKDNVTSTSTTLPTRREGSNVSKHDAAVPTTPSPLETKQSESPNEPPHTQRKSLHPEFFMEDAIVPPSPTNNKTRKKQQKQMQQQQMQQQQHQALKDQQRKLQQQQAQHHYDEDYDNPNHLYAEIHVKTRPQPLTRTASEGSASLAMTSISSITGHGSLFTKDYDTGGLSPLPGGLWRMGSTVINTAAEENYFDYSNDDTLQDHKGENPGVLERLGNAVNHMFYTTCQCFDINNGKVPMSPGVIKKDTTSVVDTKTLTTVNGTNNAVITVTTGGNTKGDNKSSEPKFSSPVN